MKLAFWIITAACQIAFFHIHGNYFFNSLANQVHALAFDFIESHPSPCNWLLESIVIGDYRRLRYQNGISDLKSLGLIGLLLVSGKQISFFDRFFRKVLIFFPNTVRKILIALFMVFFGLVNNLQPAVMRGIIRWFFKSLNFSWTGEFLCDFEIAVTCGCLIFEPSWINSLSFQFSCAATFGFAVAQSFGVQKNLLGKFISSISCLAFASPYLFNFQPCVTWLLIPLQIVILPIFHYVLMPMSFFSLMIPALKVLVDREKEFFLYGATALAKFEAPQFCIQERNIKSWGSLYLIFACLFWRFALPYFMRFHFWMKQRTPLAK